MKRIFLGRAPHGARGLKHTSGGDGGQGRSRAPHGARGLKHPRLFIEKSRKGRAPHGARGLKHISCCKAFPAEVAPHTGRVD